MPRFVFHLCVWLWLCLGLVVRPDNGPAPRFWIGDKVVVIKRQTLEELEAEEGHVLCVHRINGQWLYAVETSQFGWTISRQEEYRLMRAGAWDAYWRKWHRLPWIPDRGPIEPPWDEYDD